MVEQLVLGKVYRVSKPVETRCGCTAILQPGDFVKVERLTSPNRALVLHQTGPLEDGKITHGSGHKVRNRHLRMSVEELTDCS